MTKYKYDITRVPRELLEKYACLQLGMHSDQEYHYAIDANSNTGKEVVKLAQVPLRTKAEVDAEIAKVIRCYHGQWACAMTYASSFQWESKEYSYLGDVLNPLLKEETSD